VSVFLQFLAMMGFFFLFLQYLQLVRGYGTLEAALAVVPVAVAMMPASTAAARLTARYDNRVVGAGGLALSASGLALLSQLTATSSFWAVLIGMVITGVGLGLGMTPATNTIVQSLPPGKQGLASAVNDTSREMGGAFGIAILGSAFTAGYRSHISQGLHRLPAIAAAAKGAPAAALAVAPRLGPQSQELVHNTKAAFMSGQREALLIGTLSLLVGVAFLLLRGGAPVPDALTLPDSVELALAPARPTR